MAHEGPETAAVTRLRREAEAALRRTRRPASVLPLLERLSELAPAGSEAWRFAQRGLVEVQVPLNPWRAALALRRLLRYEPEAPELHGVLGLCHSLLGNYVAAVAAYRRAIDLEPDNPMHHHNLGHLLDVALGQPEEALPHLLLAWREAPEEHEIAASLAHCLARIGDFETAEALAADALEAAPGHPGHRELLGYIRRRESPPTLSEGRRAWIAMGPAPEHEAAPGGGVEELPADDPVSRLLRESAREGGEAGQRARIALSLWRAFVATGAEVRVRKPGAMAAGLERAAEVVVGRGGTLEDLARRYDVSAGTVKRRFEQVVVALRLRPRDPRFLPRLS